MSVHQTQSTPANHQPTSRYTYSNQIAEKSVQQQTVTKNMRSTRLTTYPAAGGVSCDGFFVSPRCVADAPEPLFARKVLGVLALQPESNDRTIRA